MKYVKDEEKKLILDKFLGSANLQYENCKKEVDALVDNMDSLFMLSQQWKLNNKQLWTFLGTAIGNNDTALQELYNFIVIREQKKNVSGFTLSALLKNLQAPLNLDHHDHDKEFASSFKSAVITYVEDIIDRLEIEEQIKLIRAASYQEYKKARRGDPSDQDAAYKLTKKLQYDQEEEKDRGMVEFNFIIKTS